MARIVGTQHHMTYAAAVHFVKHGLASPSSMFSPDRPVWMTETLADLYERHMKADDIAGDGFIERWMRRLEDAPAITVCLAAELAYIHVLFAADLAPKSKRRLVMETLGRSPDPPELPEALDAALNQGLAGTGVAFKLRRMSQLGLLITVAARWWQLPDLDRKTALHDPWAFKAWLGSVPHDGAYAQREALLHLVHPDVFEPIISPMVKQRIVASLSRYVPAGIDDVDAALVGIRTALERRYGHGFQFIDLQIPGLWESDSAKSSRG